jgi:signal transduction histidine kinase
VDLANARAEAAEEAARRRSSEERLRIARELHDIIGHSLGTIAVQAGVGRHLMETEPQKAADALDSIAKISRESLDEVRSVVATLRDDVPPYRPAPGLADLPELVDTVRATGLAVELTLPDEVEAVPRQTGAAVYRITREALTNVLRHSPTRACAWITTMDELTSRSVTMAAEPATGLGLPGQVMASRECGNVPKPWVAACLLGHQLMVGFW